MSGSACVTPPPVVLFSEDRARKMSAILELPAKLLRDCTVHDTLHTSFLIHLSHTACTAFYLLTLPTGIITHSHRLYL